MRAVDIFFETLQPAHQDWLKAPLAGETRSARPFSLAHVFLCRNTP
jgi:hypothetical protein